MDEYFKISKELNDKKYLVIDEEIDRRYNEIFRLKNELQSIDDYNKGYKDGIEKVEIDAIKEELNAIKKERQLTQENKITTNAINHKASPAWLWGVKLPHGKNANKRK